MENEQTIEVGNIVEILVDGEYQETVDIDDQKMLSFLLIGKKEGDQELMDLGLGAPRTIKILKVTKK